MFRLYFNLRGCNHPYLLGLEKGSVFGMLTHVLYELECQRLKLPVAVSHFTIYASGTAALKHAHTYTDKTHRAQQERYDQKNTPVSFYSVCYSLSSNPTIFFYSLSLTPRSFHNNGGLNSSCHQRENAHPPIKKPTNPIINFPFPLTPHQWHRS